MESIETEFAAQPTTNNDADRHQCPTSDRQLDDSQELSESQIIELLDSFARVVAICEPVKREYRLLQEAKRQDIPIDHYRRLFETYEVCTQDSDHNTLEQPFKFINYHLGKVVQWCEQLSIYQLSVILGQATLVVAMFSYFIEAPQRRQQAINDARNLVSEQTGVKFSNARIEALQFLNQNCVTLVGIQAPNASLAKIQLNQCYQWQLHAQAIAQFPPQMFDYQGANLANVELAGANLSGADLSEANLSGADLQGANLEGANLKGANLKGANLPGANLDRAILTNANLENTNLQQSRLNHADLTNANPKQANLANVEMAWVNLEQAQIYRANLEGANLSRANLLGADLYGANLTNASLAHADLRQRTNLREATVKGADLRNALFWSVIQLQRAHHWQQAIKDPNWETTIAQVRTVHQIGLISDPTDTIFPSYQAGMQSVTEAQLVNLPTDQTVEAEAKAMQTLADQGVDAILFRPIDPEASVPAIRAAADKGVVIIAIGDCINPEDAPRYLSACYESDSFQMGYDSAQEMVRVMQEKYPGAMLNVAVIDGTVEGRLYPYFKGFEQAMEDAQVQWQETASTDASSKADLPKIKAMLRDYPTINVIWSSSDDITETSVQAVEELGLNGKVMVFGILDLTPEKAQMLLDPNNPLQSIVNQQPVLVGQRAAQTAIAAIQTNSFTYQYNLIPHQVLGQDDQQAIRQFTITNPLLALPFSE